ncbi:MAG TPA: matrixin family metalloprotease [Allosphingosinicella sp.]|nr:matrixin family metalloprotease [Allosphingosinicella sp.]
MAKTPKQPAGGGGAATTALDRLVSLTRDKDYVPTAADLDETGAVRNVGPTEDYLRQFGYLQSENLQHFGPAALSMATALPEASGEDDETLRGGLRRFQAFNNLPVTGELDEATLRKMSLPRCGFPDVTAAALSSPDPAAAPDVAEFVAQGSRWNNNALTYGFQNFTADLTQAQTRAAIQQAFNLWAAVTPLTFTEVPVASTPDIVIRFVSGNHGDGNNFDGPGGVLAHAYYPPPGGGPLAGDSHFDDSETWSVNLPPTGTDLVSVAAHEFGHALGLAHSNVAGALMAPFYTGAHRQLEADDIAGIQSIYGAQSTWASLGGVITSRIAVGRNADGRLEVFARGTDNALWHIWQTAPNNGWSAWASLGGVITSNPTVISNADGRLQVFARGTDNAVWHRRQAAAGGGWANWASLGGGMIGNIAAARNADGRLQLFIRGLDSALWHIRQTTAGGAWSAWASLGGGMTADPVAISNSNGRLHVFVRGTDNAVWHRRQTAAGGTSWTSWASLGGAIIGNFSAGRNADGRLELFVRGTDHALWHIWQTAAGGAWSGWASLGGGMTADPTVVNNQDGRLEAFIRGNDNAVWHIWQTAAGGGWAAWASLGGGIIGRVAPAQNADGRLEIFVQGNDNAVWHRWQTAPNNGWS